MSSNHLENKKQQTINQNAETKISGNFSGIVFEEGGSSTL
jgi:hypothetical protein